MICPVLPVVPFLCLDVSVPCMPQAIRHLRSGCFSPQTTTATTHHLHFFPFLLLLTLSPSQNEIASCTPLSAPSRALSPGLQSASLFSSSQVMGGGRRRATREQGTSPGRSGSGPFFLFPGTSRMGQSRIVYTATGAANSNTPSTCPAVQVASCMPARAGYCFSPLAFLTCPMLVEPFLPQSILGPAAERRSRRRGGGKATDGALTTSKSTRQIAP
jgi:hypothetical protein